MRCFIAGSGRTIDISIPGFNKQTLIRPEDDQKFTEKIKPNILLVRPGHTSAREKTDKFFTERRTGNSFLSYTSSIF